MAFGLKQIKALLSDNGMPIDNLESTALEICGRHKADLDSIMEERDNFKKSAEELSSVQAELDSLKKDPYEVKYKALKEEYEQYKQDQTAKETRAVKEKAYREMLKEIGVSEKRIDAVIKVTDIDGIELDKDGAIKEADKAKENAKTEWADFIQTATEKGAVITSPPVNNGNKKETPMSDIYKKDEHGRYVLTAEQRQKAIMDNLNKGA